jgi:hypothetical protein
MSSAFSFEGWPPALTPGVPDDEHEATKKATDLIAYMNRKLEEARERGDAVCERFDLADMILLTGGLNLLASITSMRIEEDPGRAVFDALVKDEDPRDRTSQLGLGAYAGARDGKTMLDGAYDLARIGRELVVAQGPSFRGSGIEAALRIAAMTDALEPLWQRAKAPGADLAPDDAIVTVFMKDCREALRVVAPADPAEIRESARKDGRRVLAWSFFDDQWVIVHWGEHRPKWQTDFVGDGAGARDEYRDDQLGEFRELPPAARRKA